MDEQEEVQQNNMISNLPLLFANGYPTSLDKISEVQLENFIPFMVQCSLGHINLQGKIDYSEPEWWPEDLPFFIPFTKPKRFPGHNWIEKMKEVVMTCYQFHKSIFLLKFCNDLASYEHASLRFINNYNSTTSLFDRRSNKLLVTFRNENMSYDQPQRMRKCLLQQKSKNGCQIPGSGGGGGDGHQDLQQIMVEPPPFDIYLCDNCDAELYSKEAILEHEKTCNVDDDDVILCDTPEPEEHSTHTTSSSGTASAQGSGEAEYDEQRNAFLLNFNLQCRSGDAKTLSHKKSHTSETGAKEDNVGAFMIVDRNKRMPRRNRAVHSLTRCPTIPLSSPAGQLLLRTTKTSLTKEYLAERLERIERFCHAPPLSATNAKPKYLEKRTTAHQPHCTFKKPLEYSSHVYVFPRRQLSQRRRNENFLFLNSLLLRRCRPISVRLKKITEREMRNKRQAPSAKLNIKLTRDTTRSSNWKISSSTSSSPSAEVIVATIDLCSSDDEQTAKRPCKPNRSLPELTPKTTELNSCPTTGGRISLATVKALVAAAASKNPATESASPQEYLKKVSSEVSIYPVRKRSVTADGTLDSLNAPWKSESSAGSTASALMLEHGKSSVINAAITNNNNNNNNNSVHYDGNIVLSPATTVGSAKPLRPSVFILSNYTSNQLLGFPAANGLIASATAAAPSSTMSETGSFRGQAHNQENQQLLTALAATATTNYNAKRTANNSNTNTDWLSSGLASSNASSAGVGGNTNSSSTNGALINANSNASPLSAERERERTTRNLTLMQNFGSPNRVFIDLTS